MREIKFRAWDIKSKRFFNDFHIIPQGKWIVYDDDDGGKSGIWEHDISNEYDLILMQYTGLKDKNGKEIYEGDITSILNQDGDVNKFIVKYGIARREMATHWLVDIPCFYFDLIGEDFKAFPIVINFEGKHDLESMEVIGNIYENGDLLEK